MKIFLLAWACLAAVAVPLDQVMSWRRRTGRAGEAARAEALADAAELGRVNVSILLALTVALAVLLPPVVLAGCAWLYVRDRRRAHRPGLPGGSGPAQAAEGPVREGPFAALLERLAMPFRVPWRLTIMQLAVYAVAAGLGAGLRLLFPIPVLAAAVAGTVVVLAGLLLPVPGPRRFAAAPVPAWVPEAEAGQETLPGELAGVRAYLEGFAARTGRRGASLVQYPCAPGSGALCMSAMIHEENGYLLALVGVHMGPVAGALLSHEAAHTHGWQRRAWRTAGVVRLAGWLLAGWAAGWPWMIAAGAVAQAVTMLIFMAVESACDLRAAREHGADAAIAAVLHDHGLHPEASSRKALLLLGVRHLAGLTVHPPDWVRCLVLRLLAPSAIRAANEAASAPVAAPSGGSPE
jgi:hypothetical protein